MIFYHSFPIAEEASSGSQLRLRRMLQAFSRQCCHVQVVTGLAEERSRAIEQVKVAARQGRHFDFVYAESSTLPSLLAMGNFPRPLLDFRFFFWLRRHAIPIGLFYRDVYWRFPQCHNVPVLRRWVAKPMYWYDWLLYKRFVDHLFLPSCAMLSALPGEWPLDRVTALPPGNTPFPYWRKRISRDSRLRLLYVGGVTPPLYDLKAMFDIVGSLDDVSLTVCCRDFEWRNVHSYYEPFDQNRIEIIHASGKALATHYARADVFALLRNPNPYLDFAMPVKLFEALGYVLPVVTVAGTEAARFVSREDIGWVVESEDELRSLLMRLRGDRGTVDVKRKRMLQIRRQHTWRARAQAVVTTMAQYSG